MNTKLLQLMFLVSALYSHIIISMDIPDKTVQLDWQTMHEPHPDTGELKFVSHYNKKYVRAIDEHTYFSPKQAGSPHVPYLIYIDPHSNLNHKNIITQQKDYVRIFNKHGTCIGPTEVPTCVAGDPQGIFFAAGFTAKGYMTLQGNKGIYTILLWHLKDNKFFTNMNHTNDYVTALAFNPCRNDELASGSQNGVIKFWNYLTGEQTDEIQDPQKGIIALAYTQDGSQLAGSYSLRSRIKLWDRFTHQCIQNIDYDDQSLDIIGFYPNSSTIFGCTNGTKKLLFWKTKKS